MVLPARDSNISLSQIAEEFSPNRGKPRKLTDYYRGGTYVPDIPSTSLIPRSGEITLSDFHGAENIIDVTPEFYPDDKPYDSTTSVTGTFELPQVKESDNILVEFTDAFFSSPSIGERMVTVRGLSLTGVNSENYRLTTDEIETTGTITGQEYFLRYLTRNNRAGFFSGGFNRATFNGAEILELSWENVAGGTGRLVLDSPVQVNSVWHNGTQTLIEPGTGFSFGGRTTYQLTAVHLVQDPSSPNFFRFIIS